MGSTQKYMDLAAPVQGQVYGLAHSATAQRYEVPPDWSGETVSFTSSTADLYIAFGDAGVKLEASNYSPTAVGETLTPAWALGSLVPAGASRSFFVSKRYSHFSVLSSVASGFWTAEVMSGDPNMGEILDWNQTGKPLLDLNAAVRSKVALTSGAITVTDWKSSVDGVTFSEGTNKPDWFDAPTVGSGMVQPGISFVAGSSEKLVSGNSTIAAALGSANPFTVFLAVRRTATGANHTLFSVGTDGSNNGRWDITLDSSDDFIVTRVTSAGASTTSTFAATLSGFYLLTLTFDGTTPLYYQDRTSQTLTGTAAGDVGTTTKVAIGCRAYNTSTYDQFASAEIARVLVWDKKLGANQLDYLHAWAKRRFAK